MKFAYVTLAEDGTFDLGMKNKVSVPVIFSFGLRYCPTPWANLPSSLASPLFQWVLSLPERRESKVSLSPVVGSKIWLAIWCLKPRLVVA